MFNPQICSQLCLNSLTRTDVFCLLVWTVKREPTVTPPPPQAPSKPSLNEDEVSKKSIAIIEEYIHIYDTKVDMVAHDQSARLLVCHATADVQRPPCPNRRLCSACRS